MKKIKFGSMEILGYIGLIVWIAVIQLRGMNLSGNACYIFLLGILPNLGAAWAMTMLGKWIILLLLKRAYTFRKHVMLCAGILALGLVSEIAHDLFLNSPFDIYDMLLSAAAQAVIFLLPILIKDKFLYSYD